MKRLGRGLRRIAVTALAMPLAVVGANAAIIVMTGITGGALWLIS
jgi:hypothetical protein